MEEGGKSSTSTPKYGSDTLSKVWKPFKTLSSFYEGGKLSAPGDGAFFCCVHDDRVKFFTTENGLRLTGELFPENEEITCFALSPSGENIVTCSRNLLMRHWDCHTLTCIKTIKGHRMPVLAMDYDKTSTFVATGSTDNIVRVWDVGRGYCTHSFKYHMDIIRFVKFHPYSLQLFSSSEDSTLKAFNLTDSTCVGSFANHISAPTDIAFTEDGNIMISVGRDKVMNFYHLGSMVHFKSLAIMEELEAAIILPCDTDKLNDINSDLGKKRKYAPSFEVVTLITAGEKGIIKLFRIQYQRKETYSSVFEEMFSLTPLITFRVDDGMILNQAVQHSASCGITSLQYIRPEKIILVTTSDHRIIAFPLPEQSESLVPKFQYVGSFDDILGISILPVISGSPTRSISLASELLATSQHQTLLPLVDSNKLAIVSNSFVVHIVDNSASSIPLVGHTDIVLSAQCSPDGRWIVTSSKDSTCRVWCTQSLTCKAVAIGHTDSVSCLALSQRIGSYDSNCAIFVSGGGDKVLKRWLFPHQREIAMSQINELAPTHSIRAHDKDINSVAISPNDALVASGSHDCRVRLWTSTDLAPVATLGGHRKGVWCVKFSPVDKCLASSSGDRTIKLWSLSDYTCLRTFQGHTASVLSLQFVRHGMQIISAAADGLLYLWTIRTGERENILDQHSEKVWGLEKLQFSDAEIIISCGSDASIISWYDATPEEEEQKLEKLEQTMILEQQLLNCVRLKKYGEALDIALQLKYPNKILAILQNIILESENSPLKSPQNTVTGNCLNEYSTRWSMENVSQIMEYAKEWNTNSRHTKTVHTLLQSLIHVFGVVNLSTLPSLSDLLTSLANYSERHFQRIDRLHESIYLLEYLDSESSLHS